MKIQTTYRYFFIALLSIFILNTNSLVAQKKKQNKVRLNVSYVKIMNGGIYFDIKASSRINKKNTAVSNIELTVFNVVDDEKVSLGKTMTDMNGQSRFALENIYALKSDTTNTYTILVSFKGNDDFKKVKKSIEFKNIDINAKIITKDSINFIQAVLIDPITKNPIEDESLTVQVQRLFSPLLIEEFNNTNEDGSILVPIENGIPGIDGKLNIEVVLNDSDNYGTVKAIVEAPIGIPIVDESTYDQRRMWSPRNKTPIFLLIFPNLLILGIWSLIIYLIINLFKLSKT